MAADAGASTAGLYDASKDGLTTEPYDLPADAGTCKATGDTRGKGRFTDKVAVVTGAAGNFGEACARRLMSEGAQVALMDVRDPAEVAKKLLTEFPEGKARSYIADITDEAVVETVVGEIVKEFKRIDLLFNNAGYQGDFLPVHKYKVSDFRKILDINVTGAFIVLKTVANVMIEQSPRGGSIVNTASMAGIGAPPNMPAYASSKAAVKHLSVVAAKDLAPYDVRVNSVSPAFIGPGFMWTRQVELQAKAGPPYFSSDPKKVAEGMIGSVPMKRYGSLDEVMGPVLFLLSDDASYITGEDIKIIGGN